MLSVLNDYAVKTAKFLASALFLGCLLILLPHRGEALDGSGSVHGQNAPSVQPPDGCRHRTIILTGTFCLLAAGLCFAVLRCRRSTREHRKNEKLFRTVIDYTHDWELWMAPDGTLLYSSPSCQRISGYSPEELQLNPDLIRQMIHPEDRERFGLSRLNENPGIFEYRIVTRDGKVRWAEHCERRIRRTDGRLLGIRTSIRDITGRKNVENKLLLAQYAIDCSGQPVGMVSMEGRITYANLAMCELFGFPPGEDILDTPLTSLFRDAGEGERFMESPGTDGQWQGEVVAVKADGSTFDGKLQAFVTRDTLGNPIAVTVYINDITRQKARERDIQKLAFCDPLTGLLNRLALKDAMRKAVDGSGGTESFAVMMLDLDDFKQINDMTGHARGDELIVLLASRLGQQLREDDTLARLGGDEFVLLLKDIQGNPDAATRAGNLLASLHEKPFVLGDNDIYTSASIGIALFPEDGKEPEALLKHADMAMYEAKKSGRNTFRFFSGEIHRRTIERHQLEAGLRRAIRNREFFLVYQPQVDLRSGRVVAMEALVRWQHPGEGVLSPAGFIKVAEETGLIHTLGEWILRTACEQAIAWRRMGLPPMRMAVNLSAQQFRQQGLVERIENILEETGLEPDNLELEITESVFMENFENAIDILIDLKTRAIQIAIDDFGTGYSSLCYLKNFPIDRIKIAGDFVRDISVDKDDATIVETIMVMADRLGLKVLAEGVETAEQMAFLRLRGCYEMQGFYFARPMEPDLLPDFLKQFPGCVPLDDMPEWVDNACCSGQKI